MASTLELCVCGEMLLECQPAWICTTTPPLLALQHIRVRSLMAGPARPRGRLATALTHTPTELLRYEPAGDRGWQRAVCVHLGRETGREDCGKAEDLRAKPLHPLRLFTDSFTRQHELRRLKVK